MDECIKLFFTGLVFFQRPKLQGVMGQPHFKLYYWACNLHALCSFGSKTRCLSGSILKKGLAPQTSLPTLLYSSSSSLHSNSTNYPMVSHLIFGSVVRKILFSIGCFGHKTLLFSISHGCSFACNKEAIHASKDLFIDNILVTT